MSAVWLVLALGAGLQTWIHVGFMSGAAVPPLQPFAQAIFRWGPWAVLTPAVVALVARIPAPGSARWWPLAPLLVAGCAFSGLHSVAASALEELAPETLREVPVGVAFSRHLALRASLQLGDNLAVFAVVAGIAYLVEHFDRQRRREVGISRLEARLAEAQLEALEARLHPHFLYNTLNAVSALVERDPPAAEKAIAQLGDLLRATLARRGDHLTTLGEELELTERYLDLQRLRFGSRLQVRLEVDRDAADHELPRLTLQGLVENSIKHGLRGPGPLTITIRARLRERDLDLEVADDGPGSPAEPRAGGFGLDSLRERLEHLYGPGCAHLEAGDREEGGYAVRLTVPDRGPEASAERPGVPGTGRPVRGCGGLAS